MRKFTIPQKTKPHSLINHIQNDGVVKTMFIKNDLNHYNAPLHVKDTVINELTDFYNNKVSANTQVIDYSSVNAYDMIPDNVIPISLDKNIIAPYHIQVSRVFTNDEQVKPIDTLIHIPDNIKELINKKVMLVDDDTMSGWNLHAIKIELEKMNINVLPEACLFFNTQPFDDIIDASDFLPVNGAGLVMKLNGVIQRVPYYPPLVNPVTRASCPKYLLSDYIDMVNRIKEAV